MIPNMYHIQLTLGMNYRAKTSNNMSELTHSNWMTKSYYSSPKNKEAGRLYAELLLCVCWHSEHI